MSKRRFIRRRSRSDGTGSLTAVMQTLALAMAIGSLLIAMSFVAIQAYDQWSRK